MDSIKSQYSEQFAVHIMQEQEEKYYQFQCEKLKEDPEYKVREINNL
jgi:hypothetical protein